MSVLGSLGGLLASPAFSTAMGLAGTAIGGVQTAIGQLGARLANQRRYQQGMDLLNTQNEVTQNTVSPLATALTGAYGAQPGEIYNAYTNLYNPILDSMRGRNTTAMGMLEGAGAQERVDINRQFDESGAAAAANLTNRGLIGSTMAPQAAAINERSRADALGGLNERLLQQRLGLYTDLTGQEMAMRQNFGQNTLGQYFGAQNQNLAAQQSLGLMPLDFYRQNVGQTLNWISGRNDTYPDMNPYLAMAASLGAGGVQGAQPPSFDWFSPTMGAAGTVGGLSALGYFLK